MEKLQGGEWSGNDVKNTVLMYETVKKINGFFLFLLFFF